MRKDSFYKTLRKNRIFTVLFLLWLITVVFLLVLYPKGHWVLQFSQNRSPFWDGFFFYGTKLGEEWAIIGAAVLLCFVRFRAAIILPLLGLAVMITSSLTKKLFHHPRPLRVFTDQGMADLLTFVEGVDVHSGPTSFPSGHTMAGFALYTFLALNISPKNWTGILFFLLAMTVGLSRVYLVQHFLEDVYLGSVIGVVLALYFYYLQGRLGTKAWLDQKIILFSRN
ncbi:MAG TPA: phosphatase PAP2 family protein [Saprospiraceae bacterium]|nr:phosphatase PAP2 family protein [Saprospiraceae bacterium]